MNTPTSSRSARAGVWIFPLILALTVGASIAAAGSASPLQLWVFVVVMGGWLVVLCLHEFAHAAVALAGGDTSVRSSGYLTLNLVRYLDPVGSFVIPLIFLAIGAIPLPGAAVRLHPHLLRSKAWSSLVSVAGPAVNLLAGAILAWVATPLDNPLGAALAFLGLIQMVCAILNLLPVPGFDGFGIIEPYLPPALLRRLEPMRWWIPLAAFAVLWGIPGASSWLFELGGELFTAVGGSLRQAGFGQALFPRFSSGLGG